MPSLRRGWLLAVLAVACGGPLEQEVLYEDLGGTARLRLVAANLSTGNNQSYTPGEGLRILEGLHADVVMLQEFNYGANAPGEIQSFANSICGSPCSVAREAGALQIPNGIVSRYPIRRSGRWVDANVTNRGFAWAQIDIPGPHDLWAVSVHLLTSSAATRDAEAAQLVQYLRQAVPAGDYVVLGGDFNTSLRTEPALTTLSQVLTVPAVFPADLNGNSFTSAPRTKPYDWVLVSAPLDAQATPVVIGASSFPAGLVADTRVYAPIGDLQPALATDSAALNMQHMAVVRDFLVPLDGADGGVRDGGTPVDGGIRDGGSFDGGGFDGGGFDGGGPDGGPSGDVYEPDDTSASARPIALGESQLHDIAPASDQDWLSFTLTSAANVQLETSGPTGGDTMVRLYSASHRQLASDDDSGAGYYSLLRRSLPAGRYFVQITSYAGASTVAGYTVRLSSY